MKLKDGFYVSSYGIGGLMLDMLIKNFKICKKLKFKVGDMVCCEVEGFIYLFCGYVEYFYNYLVIICIENMMECDKWLVKSKENLVVVRLVDMEIIKIEL